MAESARVLSIQELQEFRAFLVKFGEGVRHGLTTADGEVQATLRWLKDEQPARLVSAQRKAKRNLELALDELRRKRLQPTATGDPPSVVQEQKVVNQAKAKLQWVEDRVTATRRWNKQFERDADGYRSSTQAARGITEALVPRALARLEGHLRALEDYTRARSTSAPAVTEPASPGVGRPAAADEDPGDLELDNHASTSSESPAPPPPADHQPAAETIREQDP